MRGVLLRQMSNSDREGGGGGGEVGVGALVSSSYFDDYCKLMKIYV